MEYALIGKFFFVKYDYHYFGVVNNQSKVLVVLTKECINFKLEGHFTIKCLECIYLKDQIDFN